MMNNKTYVEAARFLAERMMKTAGLKPRQRVAEAFRAVTSRAPLKGELDLLMADFAFYKNDFTKHPDGATKLLAVGEKPRNAKLNPVELAAYALVANTLLNLDEAIMQN
jgi:phosphoribosylformylglycinamidine (FGAM) synthase-like enzyme